MPPLPEHLLLVLLLAALLAGCLIFRFAYRPGEATSRDITIDVPRYGPGFIVRPTNAPIRRHQGAGITQISIVLAAIANAHNSGGEVTITEAAATRLRMTAGPHVLRLLDIDP
jgi:hypothetical protein